MEDAYWAGCRNYHQPHDQSQSTTLSASTFLLLREIRPYRLCHVGSLSLGYFVNQAKRFAHHSRAVAGAPLALPLRPSQPMVRAEANHNQRLADGDYVFCRCALKLAHLVPQLRSWRWLVSIPFSSKRASESPNAVPFKLFVEGLGHVFGFFASAGLCPKVRSCGLGGFSRCLVS